MRGFAAEDATRHITSHQWTFGILQNLSFESDSHLLNTLASTSYYILFLTNSYIYLLVLFLLACWLHSFSFALGLGEW